MIVMVCIPINVTIETTRRKDLREAVRKVLRDNLAAPIVKDSLTADTFVVRAPEAPTTPATIKAD